MRIIGYHISNSITDTDGDSIKDGRNYLEYLLEPKKDAIRMFFHLDYSVANLLRLEEVYQSEGEELLLTTSLHIRPYRLRYIPGKLFSIKRSGAFSYFSNAGQYISTPSSMLMDDPLVLAKKAKEVGEQVYSTLNDLGFGARSLVNPLRAYEKNPSKGLPINQIEWLYKEAESSGEVKRQVVQKIICGIVEENLGVEVYKDEYLPITLSTAIRKNKWNKLGGLLQEVVK